MFKMLAKRLMVTSATVLGLSLSGQTVSGVLAGNPDLTGIQVTPNPTSTFTLIRGGGGGGHGGGGGGHGGFGGGHGGFGGGHGGFAGGHGGFGGHGFDGGGRSFAVGGIEGRGIGAGGARHFGAFGHRGARFAHFRGGRFGRGRFFGGRFWEGRFYPGEGFWSADYAVYGDSCDSNCLRAGFSATYCSAMSYNFCY
jgi:hypothetical protein